MIERTSVNPKGVKEVDILRDKIFYFPLLYWQVVEEIPDFNEYIEEEPITIILSSQNWIRSQKGHIELMFLFVK